MKKGRVQIKAKTRYEICEQCLRERLVGGQHPWQEGQILAALESMRRWINKGKHAFRNPLLKIEYISFGRGDVLCSGCGYVMEHVILSGDPHVRTIDGVFDRS